MTHRRLPGDPLATADEPIAKERSRRMYNDHLDDTRPSFNNLGARHNETGSRMGAENDRPHLALANPDSEIGKALKPDHLRMLLQESGLSQEVVRARGYRTVERKIGLKRLGFADSQCNPPGLLTPIYSPGGEISNYQFRPNQPRIKDGKPVKYETPRNSRMILDVHPFARERLGDPSVPLFVTEGIKKGDALVSHSLCAAALLGVWNWRGTNEYGGKAALPEWEHVALNGRQVYIVFDSDIMLKVPVYRAMLRLKGFLESRGATVAVIYLPPGEGGAKQGVDDYFAAGHTVEDLLTCATTELREPPRDDEEEAPVVPYRETPYGLIWDKPTRDGTSPTPLTNFTAKITADVAEDDGVEVRHGFEIEATVNGRCSALSIPSTQFSDMGWATEYLGAGAIIYPGFGIKDHARAAVQMLSGEIPTHHVYAHTGWRKIGEAWAYLHAGGAIGPLGPLTEVEVSLGDGRLGDYLLPDPPTNKALVRAIEISLRFLTLAPLALTVPLLAAIYRAPLNEAVPVDLSVDVAGPTGAQKTEITAIAQAHYGAAFNGRHLPANWSSTENALEKQAFAAKDTILTVDDFAPTGTISDVARLHRVADRFMRAVGNRSGRGRMRADTSLRAEYHPRSLVLSSGEDLPRGQSLRARMMIGEVSRGDVDLEILAEMQRAAEEGLLASAMSAYIRWLAPRMEDLKGRLPVRHRELRTLATGVGTHARTPDIVASLTLGLETFLEFAVEAGAITDARAGELQDEGWKALGEAAAAQTEHQAGEEPTGQFIELITSAMIGGDAHLADAKTGEEPDDAERWGWRSNVEGELLPRGKRIGWVKEDGSVLLEPGAAFAAAQDVARRQGSSLPINKRTLWKRMAEKGLLASRDDARGRNTTRTTINKNRIEVVHLIPGILSYNGPNGPNEPPPDTNGPSGPEDGAVSSGVGEETSRKNGPNSVENGPSGPKGTLGPFSGEGPTQGGGVSRYLPETKVHFIDTQAYIESMLPELQAVARVALDVETTGLDPREDRVRLLTLATEGACWIIDCFKVDPRPLFPVLAEKELVIHNALFDLGMLSEMGFEMGEGCKVLDTMLLSQMSEGDYPEDEEEDA